MAILGALGDLVLGLSADTAKFQSDLGRADRMAKKFGQEVGRQFGGLVNQIAALAGARGFGQLIKSQIDAADAAFKMSQKIGISVEAFSALKYAASLSGVEAEKLEMGLRKLATGMADAQRGTGEAKDALDALKLSATDGAGKLKPLDVMLGEVADKFQKMGDGTGKAALASKLFGERVGTQLIPLLNQGRAGLEELRKEAERLGVVFSTEAAKAAEEFNDNLTKAAAGVKGLAIEIAGPLVTAVNKAIKAMEDGRKAGDDFFGRLIEGFRVLATGNDADKWNMEFSRAVEDLGDAQNRLDAMMRQPKWLDPFGLGVRKAREDVERLQKEIKRLQDIKPILIPEAPAPAPKPGKEDAPGLPDPKKLADIEKRNLEVIEAMRKAGEAAQEIERKQIEFKNEALIRSIELSKEYKLQVDEMIMKLGAAAGEAENLATAAPFADRTDRLIALRESLKTEEDLEIEAHNNALVRLEEFTEQELAHLGGKHAIMQRMEAQHQNRLFAIERNKHEAVRSMEIGTFQLAVGLLSKFAGESKAAAVAIIAIEKGLAIAQIQMNTAVAVMRAFAELGPIAGAAAAAKIKALGAIQTALVAATGFIEIGQALRGQESSGVTLPPAGGIAVAESAPFGTIGAARPIEQTTVIEFNVKDEVLLSSKTVRKLLEQISESTREGGRVVVV